ncbi:MAG: alkane 1-monooxygenase [Candidatus Kapaibacterium sp.]
MFDVLPYYRVFLRPAGVVFGAVVGGWASLTTIVLTFVILPALELVLPQDTKNLGPEEMDRLERRFGFRFLTWLWVPVQLACMVLAIGAAAEESVSILERVAMVLSLGILTGGIGITVSHELMHRAGRFERVLGDVLLMSVLYMHFRIEHVRGHHRNVATPHDPATARYGESFYRFLPRVLWHSWISAWELEAKRLRNRDRSVLHRTNLMIAYTLLQALLCVLVGYLFGTTVLLVFVSQAAIAFTILELVDYIEHYGLERRELAGGRYERVTEEHSWESTARFTNYVLFKLQRHSDHHIHPAKRYQSLLHTPGSPQMPVIAAPRAPTPRPT